MCFTQSPQRTVRARYVSDSTSRASKDQTGGSRLPPEMQGQELCDSLEARAWDQASGRRGWEVNA